jgi:hypothetical protein
MTRLSDDELAGRHPATTGLLRWFEYDHLPDHLQEVSRPVAELAHEAVGMLPDGPELTTGLRKLLEAKDCLVRQAIDSTITREAPGGQSMTTDRLAIVRVESRDGPAVTAYLDGVARRVNGVPVAAEVDDTLATDRDRCAVHLAGELRCRREHGHPGLHVTDDGAAFDR